MGIYRVYEAQLMLESLTKDLNSKKEKIIKVLLNFRCDLIFALEALYFFNQLFLGKKGPSLFKQTIMVKWYLLLILYFWVTLGMTKGVIITTMAFLLAVISLIWAGHLSKESKIQKLNFKEDLK
jgi:hypothetical protein